MFRRGDIVQMHGLKEDKCLNGKYGKIMKLMKTGSWELELIDCHHLRPYPVALKQHNIRFKSKRILNFNESSKVQCYHGEKCRFMLTHKGCYFNHNIASPRKPQQKRPPLQQPHKHHRQLNVPQAARDYLQRKTEYVQQQLRIRAQKKNSRHHQTMSQRYYPSTSSNKPNQKIAKKIFNVHQNSIFAEYDYKDLKLKYELILTKNDLFKIEKENEINLFKTEIENEINLLKRQHDKEIKMLKFEIKKISTKNEAKIVQHVIQSLHKEINDLKKEQNQHISEKHQNSIFAEYERVDLKESKEDEERDDILNIVMVHAEYAESLNEPKAHDLHNDDSELRFPKPNNSNSNKSEKSDKIKITNIAPRIVPATKTPQTVTAAIAHSVAKTPETKYKFQSKSLLPLLFILCHFLLIVVSYSTKWYIPQEKEIEIDAVAPNYAISSATKEFGNDSVVNNTLSYARINSLQQNFNQLKTRTIEELRNEIKRLNNNINDDDESITFHFNHDQEIKSLKRHLLSTPKSPNKNNKNKIKLKLEERFTFIDKQIIELQLDKYEIYKIYKQLNGLFNVKKLDEGIKGYLKCSISVLSPNNEKYIHTPSDNNKKNDDENDNLLNVLLPSFIKYEHKYDHNQYFIPISNSTYCEMLKIDLNNNNYQSITQHVSSFQLKDAPKQNILSTPKTKRQNELRLLYSANDITGETIENTLNISTGDTNSTNGKHRIIDTTKQCYFMNLIFDQFL